MKSASYCSRTICLSFYNVSIYPILYKLFGCHKTSIFCCFYVVDVLRKKSRFIIDVNWIILHTNWAEKMCKTRKDSFSISIYKFPAKLWASHWQCVPIFFCNDSSMKQKKKKSFQGNCQGFILFDFHKIFQKKKISNRTKNDFFYIQP